MKNVGRVSNFNCRLKKERNSKYKNNHCVEEVASMICLEELPVYRLHWPKVNIVSMYVW